MKLTPIHYLLYLPTALICLFIFVVSGWEFYSTVTNRPGMWGSAHERYRVSKELFIGYSLLKTVLAFVFFMFPIYCFIKKDAGLLLKTYRLFLIFLGLVVIMVTILELRFEGKG